MTRRQTRPRRAGIYVRVSQDRTGDEATTQRQERDCRDLCRMKEWKVVDVYRDVDLSAYDAKVTRPEFERLKADIDAGRVDVVVFWKLDRLARRTRDVIEVLDLLEQRGGALASVQESLDTSTPHGRTMVEIIGSMAQLSSAETSARVKSAKRDQAKEGRNPGGGNLPFGWTIEEVERVVKGKPKMVKISTGVKDPKAAAALQEAAERVLAGEPIGRVAKDLSDRGFKTHPTAKVPEGKRLNLISLRNMLANPRLAGYRVHRPKGSDPRVADLYPASWEPILDEATFRALQERFGNRVIESEDGLRLVVHGTGGVKVTNERHLLTGLIRCGDPACGDRMRRMRNAKNGDRYVCRGCASVTIKRDLVERYVVKEALTLLMGRRMLGDDRPEVDSATLEAELTELRGRMRDLSVARFVDGRITDDEFEAARSGLHDRLIAVEGRLAQAKELTVGPIPGTPFEGFDTWWDGASLQERRRVLEGAVERITVKPLSHEVVAPFRRPGVEVTEDRPVLTGVAIERRDDVSRARVVIDWRPEVLPRWEDSGAELAPKARRRSPSVRALTRPNAGEPIEPLAPA